MKKTVVITGASTGIGYAAVKAFIENGDEVFGCIRSTSDASRLTNDFKTNFRALIIDVCDPNSIQKSVQEVAHHLQGKKLHALINNAGIALPGPLTEQPVEEIRKQFDVNVFGLLEVTRAFLPLLIDKSKSGQAQSKIINISSVAGKFSPPFLGAYAATKHAVEGLSHSLRRELMVHDVDVVIVGPGNVKTPIWDKFSGEAFYDNTPYKNAFRNFATYAINGAKKGMEANEIASLLVRISESSRPKTRYSPVAQRFANWTLPRLLSDRTVDKLVGKNLKLSREN